MTGADYGGLVCDHEVETVGNRVILKVDNISKQFIGVKALSDVSVSFLQREIHAIVGENGAGKSTLVKLICGIYGYDSGNIYFKGEPLAKEDPMKIQKKGIAMIPQDLGLLANLTVKENISLGREKSRAGIIDENESRKACELALKEIGLKVDIDVPVDELPMAQRQFVAIARALSSNAELIIFDEPTSTLSDSEADKLLQLIKKLKDKGITAIYISHRLDEIFKIADRVTVLKDGFLIATTEIKDMDKDVLITKMVGRPLSMTFPEKRNLEMTECVLKLRHIFVPKKLHDISLDVYSGEILGVGGLTGMGQVSLVNAIFGNERIERGEIILEDQTMSHMNPKAAIDNGIYYISSDRRGEMLFMCRSVRENIAIATLDDRQRFGVMNMSSEKSVVSDQIGKFNIAVSGLDQEVQFLSGGNQQKTIIARWLLRPPRILLVDEPTQGIDVGTKEDVYRVLRELSSAGVTIIVIFSDMIELLGMSDRIVVMCEGRISKILKADEATEEAIMSAASAFGSA